MVWTCKNNVRYHDRIYYREIKHRQFLQTQLHSQDILRVPDDTRLYVDVPNIPSKLPYMDTFRYLSTNAETLCTAHDAGSYLLNKTDGSWSSDTSDSISKEGELDYDVQIQRVFSFLEEHPEEGIEFLMTSRQVDLEDILEVFINGDPYDIDEIKDLDNELIPYLEQKWKAKMNKRSLEDTLSEKGLYAIIKEILDLDNISSIPNFEPLIEILYIFANQHEVAEYCQDNIEDVEDFYYNVVAPY